MDVTNCTGARSPFEVDRTLYRSKARALTDKLWQTSLKWFKLLRPQTPCSTLLVGISASLAEFVERNMCPHLSCFIAKPTGSAQTLRNASLPAKLLEYALGLCWFSVESRNLQQLGGVDRWEKWLQCVTARFTRAQMSVPLPSWVSIYRISPYIDSHSRWNPGPREVSGVLARDISETRV